MCIFSKIASPFPPLVKTSCTSVVKTISMDSFVANCILLSSSLQMVVSGVSFFSEQGSSQIEVFVSDDSLEDSSAEFRNLEEVSERQRW